MKKNIKTKISSIFLAGLLLSGLPALAEEPVNTEGIVLPGNIIYSQDFETANEIDAAYTSTAGYTVEEEEGNHYYSVNRMEKVDHLAAGIGPSVANPIVEFDAQLMVATGNSSNSFSVGLLAESGTKPNLRFGYHDIVKYNDATGAFDADPLRDRTSIGYTTGSSDVSKWVVPQMGGPDIGILDRTPRSWAEAYRFSAAVVKDNAYLQLRSKRDGGVVSSLVTPLSDFGKTELPAAGKMIFSGHNTNMKIDNIVMYEGLFVTELGILAENAELENGSTTAFAVRLKDADGTWHNLPKERNTGFQFSCAAGNLTIDAENGSITATGDGPYIVTVSAADYYDADSSISNDFEIRGKTDAEAVEEAKAQLEIQGVDLLDVTEDFQLPLEGLNRTSVSWESDNSAIRINGEKAVVTRPAAGSPDAQVTLTATVSRNGVSDSRDFSAVVKAKQPPERDIIIKLGTVYTQDFEETTRIDAGFFPSANASRFNIVQAEDSMVYEVDSQGLVLGTDGFGPDNLDQYIVEYDMKQLGANATNNSQVSVGMRKGASGSYRFMHTDVCRCDLATGNIDGLEKAERDKLFIALASTSNDMGSKTNKWTYLAESRANIGMLNTSGRTFDKFYRFSAALAGNTAYYAAMDGSRILADTSVRTSAEIAPGTTMLGMQSTKVQFDNIEISKAIGFEDIQLVLDKSAVLPGEATGYHIRVKSNGEYIDLDATYNPYFAVEAEGNVTVDQQTGEITCAADGEYTLTVTAQDHYNRELFLTHSTNLVASADAPLVEEVKNKLDIGDYTPYPDEIMVDFTLPTEISGTTISWQSDNGALKISGNRAVVTRGAENTSVKLTATISKGLTTVTKEFSVTVLESYTAEKTVDRDIEWLKMPASAVTENVELPVKGKYGSSVTWTSSNPDALSNTGIVSRPSGGTVTVSLTAVFMCEDVSKEVRYNVPVKGNGSGGSGGGGGSSSGSSGSRGPSVNVTVPSETLEPDNVTEQGFTDLDEAEWAAGYINMLADKGIVSRDAKFRPNDSITREEFTKLAVVAFGLFDESAVADFVDVTDGDWFHPYVASGVKHGIINGEGNGLFGAGQPISRQDMAVILCRAAAAAGKNMAAGEISGFTDSEAIASYAVEAVGAMANAGVVSGMDDGSFAPGQNATRAQAAKMLCRMLEI